MPNPLFNRFGNLNVMQQQPLRSNILSQFAQLKNNPSAILDMLIQNGKINQQQYAELQSYKNNPEMICMYLINHGMGNEINKAKQAATSIMN